MSEWEDKAKGKFNEVKGAATGNDSEEAKGKAQQAWGNVEGATNDTMDKVGSALSDTGSKSSDNSDSYNSGS